MSQAHSKAIWRELSGSGVVVDAAPIVLRDDAGTWDVSTVRAARGQWLDLGDGAYTLIDVATEWILVDDGVGGYVPSASGSPAAVLVDDGIGGYVVTPIGPGVVAAARLYLDGGRGDIRIVPIVADALEILAITNRFQTY